MKLSLQTTPCAYGTPAIPRRYIVWDLFSVEQKAEPAPPATKKSGTALSNAALSALIGAVFPPPLPTGEAAHLIPCEIIGMTKFMALPRRIADGVGPQHPRHW